MAGTRHTRRLCAGLVLVVAVIGLGAARGEDRAESYASAMRRYSGEAARALLDRAASLALVTPVADRVEVVDGRVFTLQDAVVHHTFRGSLPKRITVRVEGGRLPDGSWQDWQSFALRPGMPNLVPLHPLGTAVGFGPHGDGTYRIQQRLLGHLVGVGALQAHDPTLPERPAPYCAPDGTCDPPITVELARGVVAELSDLEDTYALLDDTIHGLLTVAEVPSVTACGTVQADTDLGEAACQVTGTAGDSGGSGSGSYATIGYWESRHLPAEYKVNNNTADVVGEEGAVSGGGGSWNSRTWWRSTYTGLASTPALRKGFVYWTPSDIDALARGGTNGNGHGYSGFQIYFGDQYRWSIGAKPGAYDIATVPRHEMGHVLGLGHSSDKRNVMFPTIPSNTVKGLGSGDLAGLAFNYPSDHYKAQLTSQDMKTVVVQRGTGSTEVEVTYSNAGRTPWNYFRDVALFTETPGRCSIFDGDGPGLPGIPGVITPYEPWMSCQQPKLRVENLDTVSQTIERGEEGIVRFRFNAPLDASLGIYVEDFRLDVAGPLSIATVKPQFQVQVI